MPPTITDEKLARLIWEDTKEAAKGVAKLSGRAAKQARMTPEEIRILWNEEAPGWTLEKEQALLADGKSQNAVGTMKFPNRMKMMADGERFLDKYAQIKYAEEMAKDNDPTWVTRPPAGSKLPDDMPPPPGMINLVPDEPMSAFDAPFGEEVG